MRREYPNLPLVEERFRRRVEAYDETKDISGQAQCYGATVFLQSFVNTAGLYEMPGRLSGQMLSDYYITVIWEEYRNFYGVFQGNDFVYNVSDPTEAFKECIRKQKMPNLGELSQYL